MFIILRMKGKSYKNILIEMDWVKLKILIYWY